MFCQISLIIVSLISDAFPQRQILGPPVWTVLDEASFRKKSKVLLSFDNRPILYFLSPETLSLCAASTRVPACLLAL